MSSNAIHKVIEKASQFRSLVRLFTTTLAPNRLKFKPSVSKPSFNHVPSNDQDCINKI